MVFIIRSDLQVIFKVFEEGTYLPVPSQEAMEKSIGKGGNGVITNIYHKAMEFAAKKVSVRERSENYK